MNVDLTNEEHIALFRLVTHALGLWCRDESLRLAQAPCLREAGTIDLLWTAQVWATVPLLPAKIAAFLDQTSMGRLGNPIAMIPETLLVRPGVARRRRRLRDPRQRLAGGGNRLRTIGPAEKETAVKRGPRSTIVVSRDDL